MDRRGCQGRPSFRHVARAFLVLAAWLPIGLHGASVIYTHDPAGRLIRATYDDGSIVDYTYDANGNRTGAILTVAPPDTTAPSAPGTPTFSNITVKSAQAVWTSATDNGGISGYDYRVNTRAWQALGSVLTVNLSGLSPSTTYVIQVRARDGAGNIGPASQGSFATLADTQAPSVPTSLVATAANSTTVNLSWTASTDNVAVAGYRIYRNSTQIGTRTTTSYSDTTASGSTTYSYTVSAYDAANNNSAQSSAATVSTPDTIAPTVPANLTGTVASPTRINLSWSRSTDAGGSGLAGYLVYRNGAYLATSATNSYSDMNVSPTTTYSYRVAAHDNANNVSGQSTAVSRTTPAVLQATANLTQWIYSYQVGQPVSTSPNVVITATGGMGGYTYAWQRVSGDTETTVNSATSNTTGWTRAVLQNWGVQYTSVWRCRVTDSAGGIAYSPNITVTFSKENLD